MQLLSSSISVILYHDKAHVFLYCSFGTQINRTQNVKHVNMVSDVKIWGNVNACASNWDVS